MTTEDAVPTEDAETAPKPTSKLPNAAGPLPIRLLFWNTFLLSPRPIPGGPRLPAIGDMAAPAVADRAKAIGERLFGRFDVMALAEVFETNDRHLILDGWQGRPRVSSVAGPARSLLRGGGFASSGLFTVVNRLRIMRSERHQFATRGSYLHDADALANKGVLMVEVNAEIGAEGRIEVFSTHLFAGGGLLPGGNVDDQRRLHQIRMAQLDELVAFVQRVHRPGNIIVVAGDFNVPAIAPGYPDGDTAQYDDMMQRLSVLEVHDVWVDHGDGDGPTCADPRDDFADQAHPTLPDALVAGEDDLLVDPGFAAQRQRIDYVFLEAPRDDHGLRVEVDTVQRFAFPRDTDAPKRERLPRLSDHVALGVRLLPSRVE